MDCCDDRSACRRSTVLFLLFVVISLLACSPLARSRQTITTVAPICANSSAVAFPIPELAPVTRQIFPCRVLFTVDMMRSLLDPLCVAIRGNLSISIACGGLGGHWCRPPRSGFSECYLCQAISMHTRQ